MHLRQLMELKSQIESTKSEDGLGIGEREFIWLYEPGQYIKRLEEIKISDFYLAGGSEHAVGFLPPKNTDAIALIHNHPSGDISPSHYDVGTFLTCALYNHKLRYGLIASTKKGEVSGYFIMEYFGEISEIKNLGEKVNKIHHRHWIVRHKEIEEQPERFNLTVGDDIFTEEEQRNMALEMMLESKICGKPIPIPSYKFEDWEFKKI